MATPNHDASVAIKVTIGGEKDHKRCKLTLKDMEPAVLPGKLRAALNIPSDANIVLERYSDSSASFVLLDGSNVSVYKQLYRAAKAKGKLRLRITVAPIDSLVTATTGTASTATACRLPIRQHTPTNLANISATGSAPRLPAFDGQIVTPTANTSSELPQPSFHWPVSQAAVFSDKTRAAFEKGCQRSEKQPADSFEPLIPCSMPSAGVQSNSFSSAPQQFSICCDRCSTRIPDTHWHCSICASGDYDLCNKCIAQGKVCDNEEHWLIKRFVKEGKVITSTTETMAPKATGGNCKKACDSATRKEQGLPSYHDLAYERTCNSCVQEYPDSNFVRCVTCEDYDLCLPCHSKAKHGHHPAHAFVPFSDATRLDARAHKLLGAGRGVRHWATCDGCEATIYGVRHKCLDCPDWDYCSQCITGAKAMHPGHRFIPAYEPLTIGLSHQSVHRGICCDGPLCEGNDSSIAGIRYKCAVCHDVDFCANCEAAPQLKHNRTHPLIKFRTPVRGVTINTFDMNANGDALHVMGDQSQATNPRSTGTTPQALCANAASQIQIVAEVKPTELVKEQPRILQESPRVTVSGTPYLATYVSDIIKDGTIVAPSTQFTQAWTMSNQGTRAWPVGTRVCFVGGDDMFDVDGHHTSSTDQLRSAMSTNATGHEVQQGESFIFTVALRSRERLGKYISYWRTKTPEGQPFGHRLWCDVNVREGADEERRDADDEHATPSQEDAASTGSQMIFPTLEKEASAASTYMTKALPTDEHTATIKLSTAQQDIAEDIESLELDGTDDVSSSDDGFLTDDEYELLESEGTIESANNGKK